MIKKTLIYLGGAQIENILIKGSLIAFLIQGAGAALLLSTEILVARLLGVSQFGIYSMATAWINVLGLIGTLGLNHALLRFVPTYVAQGDWGSLRGLIRRANLWVGLAASAFSLTGIAILIALRNSGHVGSEIESAFTVALCAIPFLVLSNLRQSVLRGLDRIAYALLPEFILRPIMVISLLVVTALMLTRPLDATNALSLSLIAAIFAFVVGALWQHKFLPDPIRLHLPVFHDREWLVTALPLLLIVGLNLISSRIDIIMLGMLSDVENVGVYSAASRIADVIVFGLVSANAVVAPMIARLHSTGRHQELQKMVRLAAKGIFLFTVPVALLVMVFGREILALFGAGFSEGYPVLAILVGGQIVNALAGPVGYLMSMTGHQEKAAKMVALSAGLNLLLNVILIPSFGMIGAAVATAMSTATWNILMLRFVRMELVLDSSAISLLTSRR